MPPQLIVARAHLVKPKNGQKLEISAHWGHAQDTDLNGFDQSASRCAMSFIKELKRRNVFRVGATYLVGAWLLIQIAETIFPLFGFDGAPARLVVIILAIGFVPAVVLAWIFEWTPDGLVTDDEVDGSPRVVPSRAKSLDRIIIMLLMAGLTYFAADKFVFSGDSTATSLQAGPDESLPSAPLVAVLPFSDLSGDSKAICYGFAEELINVLARMPDLRVVSSAVAFAAEGDGADITKAASTLNSDYIVHGSLKRQGAAFRLLVHLMNSSTGELLWSSNFEGDVSDVFGAQRDIAKSVADALNITVAYTSNESLQPLNPKAVEHYLEALATWRDVASLQGIRDAQASFRRSLDVQPEFTPSIDGLCRASLAEFKRTENPVHFSQAEDVCEQVLQRDSRTIQSRIALGSLYNAKGDYEQAEKILLVGTELSPYFEPSYYHLAISFEGLGRFDDAERALRRSVALEPTQWVTYLGYGNFLARQQRYEEAAKQFRKIVELSPEQFIGYASLGATYYEAGNYEDALWNLTKSLEYNESDRTYFNIGQIHRASGDFEAAGQAFTKAAELNPKNYRALMEMSAAFKLAGNAAQARIADNRALAVANELVAINAADAYVLGHTAVLYAEQQDFDEALRRAKQSLELDPTDPKVRYNAALVFNMTGDAIRAREEMIKSLELGYPTEMFRASPNSKPFLDDPEIVQLLRANSDN